MNRLGRFFGGLVGAVLFVGCSGGPKPVPVKGSVQYRGKPLCPANIYFQPKGAEGKQAYASLQTDGSFHMKTASYGNGVFPGVYKVTLSVGLGNPPDLAIYDEKEKTPLEVEVPATGLDNLTFSVPMQKK
jgi:hypothetical protein